MICTTDKISDHLKFHLDGNISLAENVFRLGSKAWGELLCEARKLYKAGCLNDIDENDFYLLESDAGELVNFEGKNVMLDCPMNLFDDEEFSKYVYTRDPKNKKVVYIKFND